MALIGGAVYLLDQIDSADASGGNYPSADGEVVEVTPANFDYTVTHNEAPVLAYFWATW